MRDGLVARYVHYAVNAVRRRDSFDHRIRIVASILVKARTLRKRLTIGPVKCSTRGARARKGSSLAAEIQLIAFELRILTRFTQQRVHCGDHLEGEEDDPDVHACSLAFAQPTFGTSQVTENTNASATRTEARSDLAPDCRSISAPRFVLNRPHGAAKRRLRVNYK